MANDLIQINTLAWKELELATITPESGFRYINLCSVDKEDTPQARMVEVRHVNQSKRILEIHTDIRSPKWNELLANPSTTILGFCSKTRLQLRLKGIATLHASGTEVAQQAWQSLSIWTQRTYTGGPPGDECAFTTGCHSLLETDSDERQDGYSCFGVISVQIEILDWFQLQHQNNQRAYFTYDNDGNLMNSHWINP